MGISKIGKTIVPAVNRVVPRTREELCKSIDEAAKKNKFFRKYAQEVKSISSEEHIETILDVLKISKREFFAQENDIFFSKDENGIKYREVLINDLIDASKKNPEAINLVNAILQNTSKKTAKYVLAHMTTGILITHELSNQMRELIKVIPDIAQRTFNQKYRLPSEKRDDFMMWLVVTLNSKTNFDKIVPLFKELSVFCDKRPEKLTIRVNKFLKSKASEEKMADNYRVLPSVLELLGKKAKKLAVVDFVTKNTNLY